MNNTPAKAAYARLSYPPGCRLQLIDMQDDPQPIPPGTRGTVIQVDDLGQILMSWDNGRSLSLIPGVDAFRRLTAQELTDEQLPKYCDSNDVQIGEDQEMCL